MSNPFSNVPPPSALPSFLAAAAPPPPPPAASSAVPAPTGAATLVTSAPAAGAAPPPPAPPGGAAPPAAGSAAPPPPLMSAPAAGAPPMFPPPMTSAPGTTGAPLPPPPAGVAPPPMLAQPGAPPPPPPAMGGSAPPSAAAGPPPPPPSGGGGVPLSAVASGHLSRPRYVPPPELATTGQSGPAPLYQTGVVTGTPISMGAAPPSSVMSMPSGGGATVDYAQTPYAMPAAPPGGGYGGHESAGAPGDGWIGWLKETVQKSEVLSKVAEKARTSMDTMITTLDPQMKDIIYSGGDLDIVVASDKEVKVSAVREAYQVVFGKATVVGVPPPGPSLVPQPVGWQGAKAAAEARLQSLRSSGLVPSHQAVVAVEGFIVQLQPERWFDMSVLMLDEPGCAPLSVYTQPVEIPEAWAQRMEASAGPDHPQRWAGLQLTVGQVASETLQVPPSAWHEVVSSLSRRDLLLPAAKTLAHQHRTRRGS